MAQPGELDTLLSPAPDEADALARLLRAVLSGNRRNRLALGVRPEDAEHLDSMDDELQGQMQWVRKRPSCAHEQPGQGQPAA